MKKDDFSLKDYIILFVFAFIGILSLYVLHTSFFLIFLLSGFYIKYFEIVKKAIDEMESMEVKLTKSIFALIIIIFGTLAALSFSMTLQDMQKYNLMKAFLVGFYAMYFILFLKSKTMKRTILTFNTSWIWFLLGMIISYGFINLDISKINYPLSTFLASMGILLGINFYYPVTINSNILLQFSEKLNKIVYVYDTQNVIIFSLYLFLMLATLVVLGNFTHWLAKKKSHHLEAFFVGILFFTIANILKYLIYFNNFEFAMFVLGIVMALVVQHFYLLLVKETM